MIPELIVVLYINYYLLFFYKILLAVILSINYNQPFPLYLSSDVARERLRGLHNLPPPEKLRTFKIILIFNGL